MGARFNLGPRTGGHDASAAAQVASVHPVRVLSGFKRRDSRRNMAVWLVVWPTPGLSSFQRFREIQRFPRRYWAPLLLTLHRIPLLPSILQTPGYGRRPNWSSLVFARLVTSVTCVQVSNGWGRFPVPEGGHVRAVVRSSALILLTLALVAGSVTPSAAQGLTGQIGGTVLDALKRLYPEQR